jgi:hypothetical protein
MDLGAITKRSEYPKSSCAGTRPVPALSLVRNDIEALAVATNRVGPSVEVDAGIVERPRKQWSAALVTADRASAATDEEGSSSLLLGSIEGRDNSILSPGLRLPN